MRRLLDGFAPLLNGDLPAVGALHEAVPVREGVTADVIVPRGQGPHPVLVYLHGGGWVCGSPKTHRKLAHRFAEAGYLVFNVDYRLAPEHPFPTPFEDCVATVRFAQREAARYRRRCEAARGRRRQRGRQPDGRGLGRPRGRRRAPEGRPPDLRRVRLRNVQRRVVRRLPGRRRQPRSRAEIGREHGRDDGRRLPRRSGRRPRRAAARPARLAARAPPPSCRRPMWWSAAPTRSRSRPRRWSRRSSAAGVAHEYFVDEGMPHGYAQMEFLPAGAPGDRADGGVPAEARVTTSPADPNGILRNPAPRTPIRALRMQR